jgi:hypothetical protein
MKKYPIVAAVALILSLSGCSVFMAATGKVAPNTGAVGVGKTRGEIELQLGQPIKSETNTADGSRIDIYEYEIGGEPSSGRAVGHAVLDLVTFGGWEIVGTPIEAVRGTKYLMTVNYDKKDIVTKISSRNK